MFEDGKTNMRNRPNTSLIPSSTVPHQPPLQLIVAIFPILIMEIIRIETGRERMLLDHQNGKRTDHLNGG